MILLCLGVVIGFGIASIVQAGKTADKDMGCDE